MQEYSLIQDLKQIADALHDMMYALGRALVPEEQDGPGATTVLLFGWFMFAMVTILLSMLDVWLSAIPILCLMYGVSVCGVKWFKTMMHRGKSSMRRLRKHAPSFAHEAERLQRALVYDQVAVLRELLEFREDDGKQDVRELAKTYLHAIETAVNVSIERGTFEVLMGELMLTTACFAGKSQVFVNYCATVLE